MPSDGTAGSVPSDAITAPPATSSPAIATSSAPVEQPVRSAPGSAAPTKPVEIQLATVTVRSVIPAENPVSLNLMPGGVILLTVGIIAGAYLYFRNKTQNTQAEEEGRCDSIQSLLEQKKQELEDHIKTWPEEKLKEVVLNRTASALEEHESLAPAVRGAMEAKEKYEQLQDAVSLLESKLSLCKLSLPPIPNPDVEVRESKIEGKGVFALRNFLKGEKVLSWGERKELTPEEFSLLSRDFQSRYVSVEGSKRLLSGEPMRYVNYSCDPNTTARDNADIATRDISAGDEITSDYRGFPKENIPCNCGSLACSGTL